MANPQLDPNTEILYLNEELLKKDAELAQYIAENQQYANQNEQLQETVLRLQAENEQLSNQAFDAQGKMNAIEASVEQKYIETSQFEREIEACTEDYHQISARYGLLQGEYDALRAKGQLLLEERNEVIAEHHDLEHQFQEQEKEMMQMRNTATENAQQVAENRQLIYAESNQIIRLNEELLEERNEVEELKFEVESEDVEADSTLRRDNSRLLELNLRMKEQLEAIEAKGSEQVNARQRDAKHIEQNQRKTKLEKHAEPEKAVLEERQQGSNQEAQKPAIVSNSNDNEQIHSAANGTETATKPDEEHFIEMEGSIKNEVEMSEDQEFDIATTDLKALFPPDVSEKDLLDDF